MPYYGLTQTNAVYFRSCQQRRYRPMNKISMFFVGLDLGDKFSYITIIDQEGELIEETRLPTTKASFQRKFSTLQPCRVAMEVGSHSRWASHLLKDLGHDGLVA